MKVEKVDSIVKEYLQSNQLTIHYYLPTLLHTLTCIRALSNDFNLGKNIKEVELTPNAFNRIDVPIDCVEPALVYGMYGDERRAFTLNENISLVSSTTTYGEKQSTMPEYVEGGSFPLEMTGPYELPTQYMPNEKDKYCYNIDRGRGQIVLGQGHGVSKVYLRYESSYLETTAANVVHPYIVPVLLAYIDFMFLKTTRDAQNKTSMANNNYKDEKRLLRARLNPMTIADYYKLLD